MAQRAVEADAVAPEVRAPARRPGRPGPRRSRSGRDRPGSGSSSRSGRGCASEGAEPGGVRAGPTSKRRPRAFTEARARRTVGREHRSTQPGTTVRVAGQKNNGLGEAISEARSAAAERRSMLVSKTARRPRVRPPHDSTGSGQLQLRERPATSRAAGLVALGQPHHGREARAHLRPADRAQRDGQQRQQARQLARPRLDPRQQLADDRRLRPASPVRRSGGPTPRAAGAAPGRGRPARAGRRRALPRPRFELGDQGEPDVVVGRSPSGVARAPRRRGPSARRGTSASPRRGRRRGGCRATRGPSRAGTSSDSDRTCAAQRDDLGPERLRLGLDQAEQRPALVLVAAATFVRSQRQAQPGHRQRPRLARRTASASVTRSGAIRRSISSQRMLERGRDWPSPPAAASARRGRPSARGRRGAGRRRGRRPRGRRAPAGRAAPPAGRPRAIAARSRRIIRDRPAPDRPASRLGSAGRRAPGARRPRARRTSAPASSSASVCPSATEAPGRRSDRHGLWWNRMWIRPQLSIRASPSATSSSRYRTRAS